MTLVHFLSFPKFTLPIEGTHVVEDDAALVRWHVEKVNVGACLTQGLWEDASTIIKPSSCEGVFTGGTVHPFRVILEVLHCSLFSNSRMGNSLRYWWRHVTLSHSQASLRHLQFVNVPPVGAFLSLTRLLGNSH